MGMFKEDLKKEWEFYENREKDRVRQENEHTKAKFLEMFGQHVTPDIINNDLVEIEGLRFRFKPVGPNAAWQVWGSCPECGENTWSKQMGNKGSIAAMVFGNFIANEKHMCVSTSVGDQLVSLIRSIEREKTS